MSKGKIIGIGKGDDRVSVGGKGKGKGKVLNIVGSIEDTLGEGYQIDSIVRIKKCGGVQIASYLQVEKDFEEIESILREEGARVVNYDNLIKEVKEGIERLKDKECKVVAIGEGKLKGIGLEDVVSIQRHTYETSGLVIGAYEYKDKAQEEIGIESKYRYKVKGYILVSEEGEETVRISIEQKGSGNEYKIGKIHSEDEGIVRYIEEAYGSGKLKNLINEIKLMRNM